MSIPPAHFPPAEKAPEVAIIEAPSLTPPSELAVTADAVVPEPAAPGALDPLEGQVLHDHVKTVFRCWVALFALVGAQMGWVLRPFLGNPNVPFAWFRPRESNFFQAVFQAFASLFS